MSKSPARIHAIFLCASILAAGPASAAHVIVTQEGAGAWQFQVVRGLRINDRDRVLAGDTADTTRALHATAYRRLKAVEIAAIEAIVPSASGGALLVRGGQFAVAIPDGYRLETPAAAQHLWNSSWLSFDGDARRSRREAIPATKVFAVVPAAGDTAHALARFVLTPQYFFDRGPATQGFRTRMGLLEAVAKRYRGQRAVLALSEYVYGEMAGRLARIDRHAAGYEELTQALQFAAVSRRIEPDDARHGSLRAALDSLEQRIGRDHATVKALAAAGQSDALVRAYGEFERFDGHFPGAREARESAYRNSAALHYEKALQAYEAGELDRARTEAATALRRAPEFEEAQSLADRVQITAAVGRMREADARLRKTSTRVEWGGSTEPGGAGEIQIRRYLDLAGELVEAKRHGDARREIGKAIFLDPNAPGIRVALARLRMAEGDPRGALRHLDEPGTGEAGEAARAMAGRDLAVKRSALEQQIGEAVKRRRFDQVLALAEDGLATVDPAGAPFLYYGGAGAAILRRAASAREMLQQFLAITDSAGANHSERLMARRILALLDRPAREPSLPVKSWFSSWSIDPAGMYDPVSGAFQAPVSAIRTSNGAEAAFRWSGGRLMSVTAGRSDSHTGMNLLRALGAGVQAFQYGRGTATLEGTDREHAEFYFHYDDAGRQVVRVTHTLEETDGGSQRLNVAAPVTMNGLIVRPARAQVEAAGGEAAPFRDAAQGFVTLLNHPRVDPVIAEAFTGEPAAFGFSANRWFHPFAWDGIHMFALRYDDEGRIREAREAGAPPLEFEWYGQRLLRVVQRQTEDRRSEVSYERAMRYEADRLTGETVRFQGKASRIEYRYDSGGRLVEAVCDRDDSLDGHSRRVTFAGR